MDRTATGGWLLLLMSLASGWINRAPLTVFGLYLIAGIICRPWTLDLFHLNLAQHAVLVAQTTEISMATALFITGLKLRLPFSKHGWPIGIRLEFPALILTIAGITVVFHYITDFILPLSLVFGAIVASTDLVLASLISVNDGTQRFAGIDASDSSASFQNRLSRRYPGPLGTKRYFQALLGKLGIAFGIGMGVGKLAVSVRNTHQDIARPMTFCAGTDSATLCHNAMSGYLKFYLSLPPASDYATPKCWL